MEALISPEVLRWARKRTNLTVDRLAKSAQTDPDRVRDWETGARRPTVRQAQRVAEVLKVPFGYLYLSAPPVERLPIPDLRTIALPVREEPSANFLDVISAARRKQDWYRELLERQGAQQLSFVGSFGLRDDAVAVAAGMRARLESAGPLREGVHSWSEYLTKLTHLFEGLGLLVLRSGVVGANTRRTLDVNEFRGFAISDPVAPLVFVNARDAVAARIFTLAHEAAHIWMGQSGVSDLSGEAADTDAYSDLERFCDRVAAELLVPAADFVPDWDSHAGDLSERVQALARQYYVSTLVVLRRAFELDRLSRPQFFAQIEEERSRLRERRSGGGGSFASNLVARNSRLLVDAVLESVSEGRSLYREAAAVLEVKPATLARLASSMGRR